MIVLAGLAVAVVSGNLLWWMLLHRPYTFHSDSSTVDSINWSPDGKLSAFTTSSDPGQKQSTSTLHFWDVATNENLSINSNSSSYVEKSVWSPDGKYLAFTTTTYPGVSSTSAVQTSTAQVWVWDAITKAKVSIYTYTGTGSPSADTYWSPDGKYLAFKTYTVPGGSSTSTVQKGTVQVRVWDALTKANLFIYTYPYTSSGSSSVGVTIFRFGSGSPSYTDITWSTDDKHLAFVINRIDPSCETTSESCNGTVYIWDATIKGSTYVLHLSSSSVNIIAWSPDNARIASGSSDGTLSVWYAV